MFANYLTRYAADPGWSTIEAWYGEIRFADPIVLVAGHPIATDANTKFRFIASDAAQTVTPMWRGLIFSNPRRFPFWDRICTQTSGSASGSGPTVPQYAGSILWEPDYCR